MSRNSLRYDDRIRPGTGLMRAFGVVLLLCTVVAGPAQAVYMQAPLDGGNGIPSGGFFAAGLENADDFVLDANADVTGVRWWGSLDDPNGFADQFNVRIYEDDGGVPGAVATAEYAGVTATRTSTALVDFIQAPVYQFEFTLPASLSLAAGTAYYLGLEATDQNSAFYWLQSADSANNTNFFRQWFGPFPAVLPWEADTQFYLFDLAFELLGTTADVPEPTTALLLPLGLVVARSRRRTRTRR